MKGSGKAQKDEPRGRKEAVNVRRRPLFSTSARRHSGFPKIHTNRQRQMHLEQETWNIQELLQPQSLRSIRSDQLLATRHDSNGFAHRLGGQGAITPILYPSSGLPDRFGSPNRGQWRPWATSRVPFARSQSHSRLHSRSQPIHGCPSNAQKSPDKEKPFPPEGQTVVWGREPSLAEVSMVGTHIPSPIKKGSEGTRSGELHVERRGGSNGWVRRNVSLRQKLRVLKSRNQGAFRSSHPTPRPPALLQELAQYITRRTQHDARNSLAALPILNLEHPSMSVPLAKKRRKTIQEFLTKLRNTPYTSSAAKESGTEDFSSGALLPCRGTSYGSLAPGKPISSALI